MSVECMANPVEKIAAEARSSFLIEVVEGLRQTPKKIASKFFYDAIGAELFERICETKEYYPTRTEIGILNKDLPEIARAIGPNAMVIEFGSGAGTKTRMLLDALESPAVYVPIDISSEQLADSARALETAYPSMQVIPLAQDYTTRVEIPKPDRAFARTIVFFPGSTIGNFEPDDAEAFLEDCRRLVGADGAILLGVDLRKPKEILESAYNDSEGITARFNLHLIERLRDELHLAIDPHDFEHLAFFDETASRIEMHLVAQRTFGVKIGEEFVSFEKGEHIVTEYSYKHSIASVGALAAEAGFSVSRSWLDANNWFGEFYLIPA